MHNHHSFGADNLATFRNISCKFRVCTSQLFGNSFHHFTSANASQLDLLAEGEPAPIVSFEAVPLDLRLGETRFYLTVRQGDRAWQYPLQFRANEIQQLVPHLKKLYLNLNADDQPIDLQRLDQTIERLVDGGVA